MIKFFLIIVISLLVIANALGSLKKMKILIILGKPLLMPMLLLLHYSAKGEINPLLASALIAGWIGDIFLIKPEGNRFLAGLGAFLIGHIFYIILFASRLEIPVDLFNLPVLLILVPYVLFGFLFFRYLKNDLGPMKFPVLVYMVCIVMMSVTALQFRLYSVGIIFVLPLTGSLLFLISDSLLALSTFKGEKRFSYSAIIITYVAAQMLITLGFSL